MVKKIGVEEHWGLGKDDTLEKRLADMDEAGIEMQVLSAMARIDNDPVKAAEYASRANDELAEIMEKYPTRFSAFATLSLHDPETAAKELERASKDLGINGTMISSELNGEYIDNEKYWVLLEMAEKLDVPIYIHPSVPSPEMIEPYLPYTILSRSMWGFAADTGHHAMRLICGSIFDKYPRLKIILGHMGEGIPYWLWRLDDRWVHRQRGGNFEKETAVCRFKRKPSEYFKDNFYVTTSGMFWHPVLQFVNTVLGSDRILFATDYPAQSALEGAQFIESAPINDSDKEKICHLNTENILKLSS